MRLSVDFLVKSHKQGVFTEAFATGTAATIAPIELIQHRGYDMKLNVNNDTMASKLKIILNKIKLGKYEDFQSWSHIVDITQHQSN